MRKTRKIDPRKIDLRQVEETARKRFEKFVHERELPAITPLTQRQGDYLRALQSFEQVVVMGPAGTGKSFIAGSYAADLLRTRRIERIVITRPNVPAGRSLGFFPGTLEEKIAPWVAPLTETIRERMGEGAYETALKSGAIEIVPFEVMRGRSFRDTFVILDEAQNTTVPEIKMFLTRIGEGSRVVINGDVSQSDLKEGSGLATIIHLVKSRLLPIPVVEFALDDIVRSDACAMWVRAFHEARI